MNEELLKNADASYRLAEQKAAHYFKSLSVQLLQKTYVPTSNKRYSVMEKEPYSSLFIRYLFFRAERENLIPKGITIISNG